jgi:ribonucleoside-diphosphate reductase alpha chain
MFGVWVLLLYLPPLKNLKMEIGLETLSNVVVFNKYAKYLPQQKRRETYNEIIVRYLQMMVDKYPALANDIMNYGQFIFDKKVLPSMRALQFAGPAIQKNEARIYNCCYLPIDDYRAFGEIMFLLLGGTGVGYSVQFKHIEKLPEINKPVKEQKFLVGDSIEGWADAVKHMIGSYLGFRNTKPRFDFSDIRHKGARLITAGGKAPGPEPLKKCLFELEQILERKENGEKLSSVEVHDIVCHIADAVLAGGIRRAALISLFSADDESMLTCKFGNWWELNPQRGRANNSAVLVRHRITKEFFLDLWRKIELSYAGEPGIYFTNNPDWGTNPCCEIALRPYQFCNLCEVNVSDVTSQDDLNSRVTAAAFFGTLQAGFTDFHYLRPIWKKTTEKDALVGIGMTGIASMEVFKYDLTEAANEAELTNIELCQTIGINRAARITCVKPSGTTSCVLGTASGIHAWHNDFYIRRMQMSKSEDLYKYLAANHPSLVKDHLLIPNSAVVEIPIKAPAGSVIRTETAIDTLERVKKVSMDWIKPGHIHGDNTHNVSATISIDKNRMYMAYDMSDGKGVQYTHIHNNGYLDEWEVVGEWMWDNKEFYNGLSCLPFDGGSYSQAPFEDITEQQYNELVGQLTSIDLSLVTEEDDITNLVDQAACAGGACEITTL